MRALAQLPEAKPRSTLVLPTALLTLLLLLWSGGVAGAASITSYGSLDNAFPVSSVDLLQTNVQSVTMSPSPYYTGTPLLATEPVLRDGQNPSELPDSFGSGPVNSAATVLMKDNATIDYELDVLSSVSGYSISSIETFGHWDGGRDRQDISIHYSLVADPMVFFELVTYSFQPLGASWFSKVSVTPGSGESVLATGVAKLRFTFPNQKSGAGGYRELDVFGAPLPEPSTSLLIAIGLVGLSGSTGRRASR